jgi:nucleoside phosphorylase
MEQSPQSFDVCIVCALPEEARAFLEVVQQQCEVAFEKRISTQYKYDYQLATIKNDKDEPLNLHVSWLPRYGPQEMTLHLSRVLEECQPRIAIMTGICAGDEQHVQLGDLVVAERTFTYDNGKFTLDDAGRKVHVYDTMTYQLDANILQFLGLFDEWKPLVARLPPPPPEIGLKWPEVRCHIKPMASGSAVRTDNPFEDVQAPVRGTIAIDMEGAAFGLVMNRHPLTRWLVVKGVCDYADRTKSDAYHDHAARTSALYALGFIQAYVTHERLPRPDGHSPSSRAEPPGIWNVPDMLTFCQHQVNSYMEPLKGSRSDREKKYIEELYEVRKKVANDCNYLAPLPL